MAQKARRKKDRIRVGEVISITSLFGTPPAGMYRVDGVVGDFLMLSAGRIRAGISRKHIKITARHLPTPVSWHKREIEILKENACDCNECRQLLEQKMARPETFVEAGQLVQ
ncbi:MAG: hypothetical protein J5J00_09110 [Deltaproteobacteria bacterium]|nr:hypothetical protein [Deltaproteobacteria bacterium]